MIKPLIAEFVGTFGLVLIGTGAIVIDQQTEGGVTHLGISVAFGGIVTAMILAFGKLSGAHINPAVSIGFMATKHLSRSKTLAYILAQTSGALVASSFLYLSFPKNETLGATLPTTGLSTSFLLELWMTFLLMYIILVVSQGPPKVSRFTALSVGAVVGLEAYFGGPFTGASMNPARSFGPAVVSGHVENLWIYVVATILGALIAAFIWNRTKGSAS